MKSLSYKDISGNELPIEEKFAKYPHTYKDSVKNKLTNILHIEDAGVLFKDEIIAQKILENQQKFPLKNFPTTHIESKDLDEILQYLGYIFYHQNNYKQSLLLSKEILENYTNILSREQYIFLYMTQAISYHNLHDHLNAYFCLKTIEPYFSYFHAHQKIYFHELLGDIYLHVGEMTINTPLYKKALQEFTTIINNSNEHTPLDPYTYKNTQYKRAKSYMYQAGKEQKAIDLFQEIVSMPDDLFLENKNTFIQSKYITGQSYFFLGFLFTTVGKKEAAKDAYTSALIYFPNDKRILYALQQLKK